MMYYAALKQNTSASLPYKDTFCSPEFQFDFTFFWTRDSQSRINSTF